jgi:hypothetical protein
MKEEYKVFKLEDGSVQSVAQIWKEDKELLEQHEHDFGLGNEYPTQVDMVNVLEYASDRFLNPRDPMVVDKDTVEEIVVSLIPEIEGLFGEKMQQVPEIEVRGEDDLFARAVELEEEVNADVGFGDTSQTPSPIHMFPSLNKLLVGARSPVVDLSGDVEYVDHDGNRFEQMLAAYLIIMMSRQLREEYGDQYATVAKSLAMGPIFNLNQAPMFLNQALMQYGEEELAKEGHRDWAPFVVHDKFRGAYGNKDIMEIYRCVKALAEVMPLGKIAMIDSMKTDTRFQLSGNQVHYYFIPMTPNHDAKLERFNS